MTSTPPQIDQVVLDAVREVLPEAVATLDANFFELGGDSLAALQLTAALQEAVGTDLSLELVFECRSLRELAERVAEDVAAQQTGRVSS